MAGTDFIDFYRSTFMGQRDQVNAEKKAEKAAAKAAQAAKEASDAQDGAKYAEGLKKAQDSVNAFLSNLRDAVEKAAKDATAETETSNDNAVQESEVDISQDLTEPGATAYDVNTDTYYYVYKPGDTFGQVIRDLGLGTNAGLWGEDGDVAYYTQQLVEQGALDSRGNIPVGTKIKLRRRGVPEIQMSPEQTQVNASKIVQDAKYPAPQKVTQVTPRLV